MQISKSKLQKEVREKMFDTFFQLFADLKDKKEVETFLTDFLTDVEKVTLAKRLMTAFYLEQGRSYEYIKSKIKVSSATIASVDKMMTKNSEGFALVLKNIQADQWAGKAAKRVTKLVDTIIGK
jgi:TrpR-related protein YerC/YecD